MTKPKILVVEDDRSLASVLEYNFSSNGYDVFVSNDGQDAINQARLRLPDLVVLDLMVPVIDGLEVCKTLRSESATRNTPIIMLTAKTEESDELVGFSVGADDYVSKPFSVKILLQRVKSLLRRNDREKAGSVDVVTRGNVTVDRTKHRVIHQDRILDLTPSEFRLLDTLIRQPGRAFERSELIDAALGADSLILERTIDVHIRSLRKKLKDSAELIQTVRGVGYCFKEELDGSV
jgi:two-component system phosphate regulon response regulator PhoB